MDPKFQSSFIPRAPVVGSSVSSMSPIEKSEGFNFFGIVAVIIFVASLLSLGGVFAYKKITENSIIDLESELAAAQASLDKQGIDKLADFDRRIRSIRQILSAHVAVSGYLKMLEQNTVSNVEFKNLRYSAPDSGGQISITMDGKTGSYAAVAEEEAVLEKNPSTVSVIFDNLSLNKESGGVTFVFKGTFKGDLVKFKADLATSTEENI